MSFFDDKDALPRDLFEAIVELKTKGKLAEAEAAIRGYLHPQRFPDEPWMYEMLAVLFEFNLAEPEYVQQALASAAIVADRPGDKGTPNSLLTIIDLMASRELFEIEVPQADGSSRAVRVADLIDRSIERLPGRPEPLIKSLDLAEREVDSERMAVAVEGLMELGWPGVDEAWRTECRLRALALAKRLREAGRTSEAESLIDRLEAAEPRDIYARLTWDGYGDLDLVIDEPLGATAEFRTPRTVFGGALVKNGRGADAEEVYVCPRGFDGSYTFRVIEVVSDAEQPITAATLEVITHEGSEHEKVFTFTIDPKNPAPIEVPLEDGRRREVLPFVIPKVMVLENPGQPLTTGIVPEDPDEEPAPSRPR